MILSVCLNSITGNMPRTDAMRLAKKVGYTAVEFWEGSDFPINEYKDVLDETGLDLAIMGGASGLTDPNARSEFIENLHKSFENAKILGAKSMIATTGWTELPNIPREVKHNSIVEGLKEAAKIIEGSSVCLCLEPLNILVNHAGYYLDRSDEGFDILRAVNSPNVKLLFDIYHQQITEGNLIANITANIDLIGHFHIAGNPGRHEPFYGEINYPEVYSAIKKAGYTRYAGLEYWARGDLDIESSLRSCLEN